MSTLKYCKQQIQIRRKAHFIIPVYPAILTCLLSSEVQLVKSNRKSSRHRTTLEKDRLPEHVSLRFILTGHKSQFVQNHFKGNKGHNNCSPPAASLLGPEAGRSAVHVFASEPPVHSAYLNHDRNVSC